MKYLKNPITIIFELAALIFAILWYLSAREYEPLIAIIVSFSALISSLSAKLFVRPKIVLYHTRGCYGQMSNAFLRDKSNLIILNEDKSSAYWNLSWCFSVEVRNNSSHTAYSVNFEYLNMPQKTDVKIENEIGAIEPINVNDKKNIGIKLTQKIVANSAEVEKYYKEGVANLMAKVKIIVKYKDEYGTPYCTEFTWNNNQNKFK